jgi:hypothetical protein
MVHAMAKIRAVLVGIDEYESPAVPTLRGCVNDVALVRWLLKTCFGVPNEDIRAVVNERATKANILHRLVAMIRAAEPGDLLVFYFSGHGSQIRDRDGDELVDQLDEVICPYDMDWDARTYILDDDLDAIFDALPPDILLEAFFDCCFWGAGPRELTPEPRPQRLRADVRYLLPPLDIAARAEGEEDQLRVHHLAGSGTFRKAGNVYWSASQEGEPAAEDFVEGRPNGVFTYWGCRFIAENLHLLQQDEYSREQLVEDLRSYLRSLGYAQTPELAAPARLRAGRPLEPPAVAHRYAR